MIRHKDTGEEIEIYTIQNYQLFCRVGKGYRFFRQDEMHLLVADGGREEINMAIEMATYNDNSINKVENEHTHTMP